MSVQIYSYSAFIRLVTDSSVLLLAKSQIKSVEVVRNDSVKISSGEGPLNEILIKLSDVTVPSNLVDVSALRDAIAHMLDHANLYEDEALLKLQTQIDQLIEIKQLVNLWQGNLQIDLNFQQLQVNALVAINNRLLESKENDERLINQVHDQVTELKSHTLQLVALDGVMTAIKAATESDLSKQDAQNNTLALINQQQTSANGIFSDINFTINRSLNMQDYQASILTDIKVTDGLIKTTLADILNELNVHTSMLSEIDATLKDHKTQNTTLLNKQDIQISLLTAIRNGIVGNP